MKLTVFISIFVGLHFVTLTWAGVPKRSFAKITPRDHNANMFAPVFINPPFRENINVNAKVGTFILQVTAHDDDMGINGKLSYSITHQEIPTLFSIDPATGSIEVARKLKAKYGSQTLTVTVTDDGDPPKTATTTVQINIVDPNQMQ